MAPASIDSALIDMTSTGPKTLIFDLDGTLVDTAPDLLAAANRLLAEHQRRSLTMAEIKPMIGDGAAQLVARSFAETGGLNGHDVDALTATYLAHLHGHGVDESRPYPGIGAALMQLKEAGHVLGVCTNKPYAPSIEVLEQTGLIEYFSTVIGGDSLDGIRKPDPRHLLAVVTALDSTAETTVFIGDSENDAGAAHAAGIPFIAVSFGYARVPLADLNAAVVIDAFATLPDAVRRLS